MSYYTMEDWHTFKSWYKNGKLHRDDDLPAIEYTDGHKMWYKNDEIHRDGDLPAIEYANGSKKWYKDGLLHRDGDLPAVEYYEDGDKMWYKNGVLHRDGDNPAIEYTYKKEWWKNGVLYRDGDLPAVEYFDGTKKWYKNGELHRDGDLPAVERCNGMREWWKNGLFIKKLTLQQQIALQTISKFRTRVKTISNIFGVSPKVFFRLVNFIKQQTFAEWWYHPDNPGGKRHKRIMRQWLSEAFKN